MKIWILLLIISFSAAGCALPTRENSVDKGQDIFGAMQAATLAAAEQARERVVLVKLLGIQHNQNRNVIVIGDGSGRPSGGEQALQGIVLAEDGYVVVGEKLDEERFDRIEVWVGDRVYPARLVQVDNQLDMSLLKVDADAPLAAFDFSSYGDLSVGGWFVAVQATDEDSDYEPLVTLGMSRGLIDGHYRTFLINEVGAASPVGTVLMSLDGKPAGIMQRRRRALAIRDLQDDFTLLLADARGDESADRDAMRNAWLGILMMPINREYAWLHDLDRSSLWVQNVVVDGSAYLAEIRNGDLIVGVNGEDILFSGRRARQYFVKMLRPREGAPFRVTVLRDGERLELSGEFVSRSPDVRVRADDLGVTVRQIRPGTGRLNNFFTEDGVLVEEVRSGSAAAVGSSMRTSLLNRGDIITAVEGIPTPDIDAFSRVLETVRRERPDVIRVDYMRGRVTGIAALNLQLGDSREDRSGL